MPSLVSISVFACDGNEALTGLVKGHGNMWNSRVLHRDISYRNILLGAQDAPEGSRGVLIDMDRAVVIEQDMPLPKADHEIVCFLPRSLLNRINI